jgi:hypothetical protein
MAAYRDLIWAKTEGLKCASVWRAEFNFIRFAVGKDLNHGAGLSKVEIVFGQVACENDQIKQFDVHGLTPPVFNADSKKLISANLNRALLSRHSEP